MLAPSSVYRGCLDAIGLSAGFSISGEPQTRRLARGRHRSTGRADHSRAGLNGRQAILREPRANTIRAPNAEADGDQHMHASSARVPAADEQIPKVKSTPRPNVARAS